MKLISTLARPGQSAESRLRASYLLADSALLRHSKPFFIPEQGGPWSATPALAVTVGKLGKSVAPRFAHRYCLWWAPAILFRAEGLLGELRSSGLPCSAALSFDGAACVGDDSPFDTLTQPDAPAEISWLVGRDSESLLVDGNTLDEIYHFIAGFSATNTIRNGDMFLLPLPTLPTPLVPDTKVEARQGDRLLLRFNIK